MMHIMTIRMALFLCFLVVQAAGMDAYVEEEKLSVKSIVITNTTAYPSIVLVCCTAFIYKANCYKVQENTVLDGYGGGFHLFAFPKELLEEHGGVWATNGNEGYLVDTEIDFLYLIGKMDGAIYRWEEIPYDMPMESDTLYYELTGVNDVNVSLRLKKRVITFTDTTLEKTIRY